MERRHEVFTPTEKDIEILKQLNSFQTLTRKQISELCYSEDQSSRIARRRMQKLFLHGYIYRESAPQQEKDRLPHEQPSHKYSLTPKGLSFIKKLLGYTES